MGDGVMRSKRLRWSDSSCGECVVYLTCKVTILTTSPSLQDPSTVSRYVPYCWTSRPRIQLQAVTTFQHLRKLTRKVNFTSCSLDRRRLLETSFMEVFSQIIWPWGLRSSCSTCRGCEPLRACPSVFPPMVRPKRKTQWRPALRNLGPQSRRDGSSDIVQRWLHLPAVSYRRLLL